MEAGWPSTSEEPIGCLPEPPTHTVASSTQRPHREGLRARPNARAHPLQLPHLISWIRRHCHNRRRTRPEEYPAGARPARACARVQ
ncbi:hypothetical protein NDU88_003766 [Pleurodeles waltl]|uniref:Uncharacterized protein n=1 Tax=Pleurodeles waltl TaxID=8319 RepID=A0AAV7M7Y0_PLEWA|nr:hypothetical protein NDU88_003766 [Pleurodeles waltl]